MRVLLDHSVPRQLRSRLREHDVGVAAERGWGQLSNGRLLAAAHADDYESIITADQSIPYQQNLQRLQIAVVVLTQNRWKRVRPYVEEIREALDGIQPGEVRKVEIP